jgi:hypothetical protein
MTDSEPLVPPPTDDPALTGPESVFSEHRQSAGPLPSSTWAAPPDGPLTLPDGAARAAELAELSRRAALYATRARGDGTRRAYRTAWRQYETWCPDTIAMHVVRLADAGLAVSSIRVALAAIRTAHLLAGRANLFKAHAGAGFL